MHGENTYRINDTLEAFFEEMLASSSVAGVNWSETEDLAVVARESIDLSPMYGGRPASFDQVLTRQGEALVLFTRECSPKGEVLTRTTLPLPLDLAWAQVHPNRPAPIATFALLLQPDTSDGIVAERSDTTDEGRWKNSTRRGAPVCVTFESTDRERLMSLRQQLFGATSAAQAQAKQDRQAAIEEKFNSLSPEDRTAALLQAALLMKEKFDRDMAAAAGGASDLPSEIGQMAETVRMKMQQMVKKARQKIAENAPDADALRRIEDYLRDSD